MIKAVIFDWGGVISQAGKPDELSKSISKKLGVEIDYASQLFSVASAQLKRGFITEDEFWSALVERHGSAIDVEGRDIWVHWDGLRPEEEMLQLIKDVKGRGLKTAILSNTYPPAVNDIRENGGYEGYDAVICSSEVGYAKPDTEIYRLTLERLGLEGNDCAFIDDQQRYLDPAKEFGMTTILAKNFQQIRRDLEEILNLKP